MSGIKGSFKAVGESRISERVCGKHRKSRYQARYPAKGEPSPTPLGIIEVIHAAPRGTTATRRRGVLAVVPTGECSGEQPTEKKLKFTWEPIAFNDNDLKGTIQPHDDALVVTAQVNGFIV